MNRLSLFIVILDGLKRKDSPESLVYISALTYILISRSDVTYTGTVMPLHCFGTAMSWEQVT